MLAVQQEVKFKDNIDKGQREALRKLRERIEQKEIVVTKADKGSGIVIVDYDTYISKGSKYIEEEAKAYTESVVPQKQLIAEIVKDRDKLVKVLVKNNIILPETGTYCTKQLEEKITGMKFYYKVHKDSNITTMPLRPLQSCIAAPTHYLSQVLTDILQPLLTVDNIPTYIQDSNKLLYRLHFLPPLPNNCTLVSSDVSALYPSIPHPEGMIAMKSFLEDKTKYSNKQVEVIIKALELVITKNYVMWNNKIYKQTNGVAMGTPVAVAYANIFMHWVDSKIKEQAPFIIEHIRYIDDNLFILPEDNIEKLMEIANTILYPNIRFTYEKLKTNSEEGLAFLDTQLFISSEFRIESRLYTKKTDKHTFLLPSSYHPAHVTRNIPLPTFNCIRRIYSRQEWFEVDAAKTIEWLENRGYDSQTINTAIVSSNKRDRWQMIVEIEKNRTRERLGSRNTVYEIPLIATYGQKTKKIRDVLKKRQDLLDVSFHETSIKPRLSFRRQRNLNDMIIQKSLRGLIKGRTQEECIFKECGEVHRYRLPCPCNNVHDKYKCRCCMHARQKLDYVEVKIHKMVTCETKNVIYVIGCNACSKKYVGETQQKLKDRLSQHLYNINKLNQPLYVHFKEIHRASNLYISVLETVNSPEQAIRKIREAWWINKLQTLEPKGFNVKLDCYQVYTTTAEKKEVKRNIGGRQSVISSRHSFN